MEVDDDAPQIMAYHSSSGNIPNSSEVIETIDVTNYPVRSKKNRHSTVYDKNLCKDNKPLTEFINKCIFLDPTKGMETIINKVLLLAYVKADAEYKNSEKFRKVVTKAFERLINDPARKYSHISDVVETLKLHVSVPKPSPPVKKRVNLITLSTKVSGKFKTQEDSRKRPIIDSSAKISPKKSKPEVIALDCDDVDEVIPIDDEGIESNIINQLGEMNQGNSNAKHNLVNDDDDDDAIEIQDSQEVKIIEDTQNDDKENKHLTNKSNDDGTVIDEKHENNELIANEHEKENLGSNENLNDENKLLVPRKEKNVRLEKPKSKKVPAKKPEEMTDIEKAERIKMIETKIEKCNKTIAKLDLEEVTDDSANSPYYKCDRLRATIVKLYKELCTLVKVEAPPERNKIRFHIKEGLPEGPIKRLEKFLNKKANAEGETTFPDFSDVVGCVQKANEKDQLGWSKAKVMKEAQEIFTYCGRSLQKWRQQREWRDLRGMARPEEFEADPAEQDPELQARLEANTRLARQREAEVFSKFTRMGSGSEPTASTSIQIEPSEHEDSSCNEETEPNPTEAEALKESNNNDEIQNPTEATVLNKINNNIEVQDPIETTSLKENINNDKTQSPAEATLLEENISDNIVDADGLVIKQEPEEVPIKIQYQGDISLVIEISDSDSEDE